MGPGDRRLRDDSGDVRQRQEGRLDEGGILPRKANLSLYLTCDLDELSDQLADLGTYSRGKGCLYIKKLSDVDQDALTELIEVALANVGE